MVADIRNRRIDVVGRIAKEGMLSDESPLCGVIDLDTLHEHIDALEESYESAATTLHTVAAKSVTLGRALQEFSSRGMGCEVATPGELQLALEAGFPASRIVFDSPAKTRTELREAVRLGLAFNIDNFEELNRVDQILADELHSAGTIGVRINPQTGSGSIDSMSTATNTSKFGLGLRDARREIVDAFVERPWLTQLHVHSGSQGVSLEQSTVGVRAVVDLAHEINERVGIRRVTSIDIGGGLPVNFSGDEVTPTFAEHRAALEAVVPELFTGEFELVTEFGRSLTAKSGLLVGGVEYVKTMGERRIAITHIGVQVATRTIFAPNDWPLRVEVFTPEGSPKYAEELAHDVAGPACFAGDLIARDRTLPRIDEGDLIAVPDTGGYYFTMHYSFNVLPRPAIYVIGTVPGEGRVMTVARRAQTPAEMVAEMG